MKPGFHSRQVLLWSALALSVVATIWTSLAEDEDQENAVVNDSAVVAVSSNAVYAHPAANPAGSSASAPQRMQLAALTLADSNTATDHPLDTRQLQRPRWEDSVDDQDHDALHDPFQGNSRKAVAEAAPLQAAQQVMEIPPLPFSYAGKLMDNGQYTVFLSAGEQNYSVKRGDVVLGWQVKSIAPPTMVMRYQAMQMDVPLMIGEQN